MLPNDPDQLAALLGQAGLKYDGGAPPAVSTPAPAPPPAALPPDVAARVAQQNAVADTSAPTTMPPPSTSPAPGGPPQAQVFAKPKPPPPTGLAPGFGGGGGGGNGAAQKAAADYLGSLRAEAPAMQAAGDAEAKVAENEGVAAGLRGQQMASDQDAAQKELDDFRKESSAKLAEIGEASKDASGSKVNNNRWAEDNPGRMVGLAIAAGFQGFSNGLRGIAGNQILDMMSKRISEDVESQKADIESKRGRVADLRGELADMYRRFGDMHTATAAAKIAKYQQLDEEAKQYGATAQSDVVRARADVLQKHFQSEIAREALNLTPKGGGANIQGAIVKRAQELRDKAAGNGVDLPIDEARNQATAEVVGIRGYGAQGYAKGAPAGQGENLTAPPPAPLTFGERVQSYLGNKLGDAPVIGAPLRNTEGYRKGLEQDAANIPALQMIHRGGVRDVEAQRQIGAPILYGSSDDAATRAFKNELRRRMAAGGKAGDDAGPPEDFEEDAR
jgi:hypothetical protein